MDRIEQVTQTKGHFQSLVTQSRVFDLAAKFFVKNFVFWNIRCPYDAQNAPKMPKIPRRCPEDAQNAPKMSKIPRMPRRCPEDAQDAPKMPKMPRRCPEDAPKMPRMPRRCPEDAQDARKMR